MHGLSLIAYQSILHTHRNEDGGDPWDVIDSLSVNPSHTHINEDGGHPWAVIGQ